MANIPNSPEELYLASSLVYGYGDETIRAGREVAVMGIDGSHLGVGKFLGAASQIILGEPSFMPVLEVQGEKLFGYEFWWTVEIDEELRNEAVRLIGEYMAEIDAEDVLASAQDSAAQEAMGINFELE